MRVDVGSRIDQHDTRMRTRPSAGRPPAAFTALAPTDCYAEERTDRRLGDAAMACPLPWTWIVLPRIPLSVKPHASSRCRSDRTRTADTPGARSPRLRAEGLDRAHLTLVCPGRRSAGRSPGRLQLPPPEHSQMPPGHPGVAARRHWRRRCRLADSYMPPGLPTHCCTRRRGWCHRCTCRTAAVSGPPRQRRPPQMPGPPPLAGQSPFSEHPVASLLLHVSQRHLRPV